MVGLPAVIAGVPLPVEIGTVPGTVEGSKCVTATLAWDTIRSQTGAYVASLNLLSQFNTGQFTTVQAVYVDNLTVAYTLSIVCSGTGQRIIVPPFSSGMYPLIVGGNAPTLSLTLNNSATGFIADALPAGTSTLQFLNTPQKSYETRGGLNGSNFQCSGYSTSLPLNAANGLINLAGIGANDHIALNSLTLGIWASAAWPYNEMNWVMLKDSIGGYTLWCDSFGASTTSTYGMAYHVNIIFPTPVITKTGGAGITISLMRYITGNIYYDAAFTYNILTIQ